MAWNQLHSPPSDPGKADGPHRWAESQKASWFQRATPQHPGGRREESPCQSLHFCCVSSDILQMGTEALGGQSLGRVAQYHLGKSCPFCLQNLHPLLSPMAVSPMVQPVHASMDACTSPFSDSTYSSRKQIISPQQLDIVNPLHSEYVGRNSLPSFLPSLLPSSLTASFSFIGSEKDDRELHIYMV